MNSYDGLLCKLSLYTCHGRAVVIVVVVVVVADVVVVLLAQPCERQHGCLEEAVQGRVDQEEGRVEGPTRLEVVPLHRRVWARAEGLPHLPVHLIEAAAAAAAVFF